VLSADHIYKLDLRDVVDQHLSTGAEVTMVTTQVSPDDASRYGLVEPNRKGRVTNFDYKPENPQSVVATTEVFVYNTQVLMQALDELASSAPLKDFGHELLPRLVKNGRAFSFPFEGYWRDVGTVESYWQAHMDLLQDTPSLTLDDPRWPVLSYGTQRIPARIHASARVENSLVSSGCVVRGRVINSVLSPGVMVEEGAVIRDSILLPHMHVERGAHVHRAIADEYSIVGEKARVSAQSKEPASSENITLLGRGAKVAPNARVKAGARLEPDATT
jgi:glucose-1-phosphate adenylyltransferase